jgi:hypothetical protein
MPIDIMTEVESNSALTFSVVITEECNVIVNSEELIGITENMTL